MGRFLHSRQPAAWLPFFRGLRPRRLCRQSLSAYCGAGQVEAPKHRTLRIRGRLEQGSYKARQAVPERSESGRKVVDARQLLAVLFACHQLQAAGMKGLDETVKFTLEDLFG